MENGENKRKTPRTPGKFIVSYRIFNELNSECDITQTKNIGGGGMLLNTTRSFEKGIILSIDVRLPFAREPLHFRAEVIESKEMVKNLIYDTRVMFIEMNEQQKNALAETLNHYLGKYPEKK
jgi:hypothetical protein